MCARWKRPLQRHREPKHRSFLTWDSLLHYQVLSGVQAPSAFFWVSVILTDSPLAQECQGNFGEGWETGQWAGRDPPQGCWGIWGLAAFSTASSCLQMFFKACGLRPSHSRPRLLVLTPSHQNVRSPTALAGVWGL